MTTAGGERERRPSILVVDDVPMFRELERIFLGRLGDVRTVASAADAFAALNAEPADVVVLDCHLPDMDGPEVCRRIRAHAVWGRAAVVMVSGGRAEEHASAIHAGASDVVAKPLSRHGLVQAVGRFLMDAPRPIALPRVTHETPVRYVYEEREGRGVIRNLSRGGLFIQADWLPPEGAELSLEFTLPGRRLRLEPTAQIVWRRFGADEHGEAGVGVRFVGLDGGESRELEHFVHERVGPQFYWSEVARG